MRLDDEAATRLVPYERWEFTYARNRLEEERPPWPKVGDELYYRRYEWSGDADLVRMRVVDVQSPDDVTSEWAANVNQVIHDNMSGGVILDPTSGKPVVNPVADPWPWVILKYEGEVPKGSEHDWKNRPQMTWESRVRGSAGWVPLDYLTSRKIRLPAQIKPIIQPLQTPRLPPSLPAPAPRPE